MSNEVNPATEANPAPVSSEAVVRTRVVLVVPRAGLPAGRDSAYPRSDGAEVGPERE